MEYVKGLAQAGNYEINVEIPKYVSSSHNSRAPINLEMNPQYWQKVKGVFDDALKFAPAKREKFLEKACGGDADLRLEVEKLLVSFEGAASFMEQPAAREVAVLIMEKKEKLTGGQNFGHYEIIKQIGAGGMGEVYLAQDTRLERKAAIKILNNSLDENIEHLNRFVQEARSASALNHPNIITIYEIGESEGLRFIASEFIKGETLRERMQRESLTLPETLDIAVQIASALQAAHEARIIHRDIKPENVVLREDGLVKVLDFGLAKLTMQETQTLDAEAETHVQVNTKAGMILGTPAYMSPEQARGQKVDGRTDIWSFAVVLYEMLTGRQPFAGETTSDAIAAILKSEPAPTGENTPPELNRIVRKALQKKADERYQTVKDLLLDLKNLKRELEFSEELERSHIPSFAKSANIGTAQSSKNATVIQPAAVSTQSSLSLQSSSAEYVVGEVKKHKFVLLGIVAAFVVALAAIGYFAFFAARTATAFNSVAVLPFVNGSNDANLDYLSDGLSESVIDRLSQLPQLKVIARSSSFKYRGENIDVQDVANKLDVQAIITGRVVQRGDNLSIRVEMVDARDNKQLWGEQYNRKATDALVIQQEIAQTVSEKLRLKLSGAEEQKLAKNYTENAEAYQLYLRGHFLQYKVTPPDLYKSIEFYQQAVALDPNFALAYVGLAESTGRLTAFRDIPRQNYKQMAREYALKAVSLDDQLPEARATLGSILFLYDYDPAGAEREYQRSLELNPNYS
ncbi:MAG: protein kinase domain-containing protein [Pyrinomonadaceae bacterium]